VENIAGSYPAINCRVGAVYGNDLGGDRAGDEEPEGYERGEIRHLKERKGEETRRKNGRAGMGRTP
jgi:hypothetical protein